MARVRSGIDTLFPSDEGSGVPQKPGPVVCGGAKNSSSVMNEPCISFLEVRNLRLPKFHWSQLPSNGNEGRRTDALVLAFATLRSRESPSLIQAERTLSTPHSCCHLRGF